MITHNTADLYPTLRLKTIVHRKPTRHLCTGRPQHWVIPCAQVTHCAQVPLYKGAGQLCTGVTLYLLGNPLHMSTGKPLYTENPLYAGKPQSTLFM